MAVLADTLKRRTYPSSFHEFLRRRQAFSLTLSITKEELTADFR